MRPMIQPTHFIALLLIALLGNTGFAELDFSRDVQPILAEHCYACHGADQAEGGLRLDREESATRPADSGDVAVVPHDGNASKLLKRVEAEDPDVRMPPDSDPLSLQERQVLRQWITEGAPWTQHWAYRPLDDRRPPKVEQWEWIRSPIDQYVLSRLETHKISPSPTASRSKLMRRLTYDLLGMPAELNAVRQFVNDPRPDAYERLVDRLLASPHFGERWGRHWLDKARYADSDGYEKDNNRPNAWRYRDWVVDAINADMPFDQFTMEQLAGDVLPNASDSQILATAFHRQTLTNTEGGTDQEQWRVAAVMDRTETLGTVWLGMTVGCARCHNHKYDQISQAEYYQLYAFFNNADEVNHGLPPSNAQLQEYQQEVARVESQLASKRSALMLLDSGSAEIAAKRAALEKEIAQLENSRPPEPRFMVRVVARRNQDRRTTHILRRGEFKQPLGEVQSGTLSTLPGVMSPEETDERLQLASWLVDGRNPLVPRVVTNQIWQRLFGRGIVATPNDFGVRGELPSHPRLLDFLAQEYVRLGWSRKALIRQIVLSATYRQASRHRPELTEIDPQNRMLYRQNRFRLEAESLRDVTLAVSGLLSRRIGGPSVFPPMPAEAAAVSYANNFQWKTSSGENRYRRGMYTYFKRTAPHPTLTTFDCPDANVTNVQRNRSNTPIGALVLLNNEVYREAAIAFATQILAAAGDDSQRMSEAFAACTSRTPTASELAELLSLLDASRTFFETERDEAVRMVGNQTQTSDLVELASWSATARAMLNLDEFITRD